MKMLSIVMLSLIILSACTSSQQSPNDTQTPGMSIWQYTSDQKLGACKGDEWLHCYTSDKIYCEYKPCFGKKCVPAGDGQGQCVDMPEGLEQTATDRATGGGSPV